VKHSILKLAEYFRASKSNWNIETKCMVKRPCIRFLCMSAGCLDSNKSDRQHWASESSFLDHRPKPRPSGDSCTLLMLMSTYKCNWMVASGDTVIVIFYIIYCIIIQRNKTEGVSFYRWLITCAHLDWRSLILLTWPLLSNQSGFNRRKVWFPSMCWV